MSKIKFTFALFSLLLTSIPGNVFANMENDSPITPKPELFAGQIKMLGSEGDLMQLELPSYVYQHVERTDLGDIRVFDSSGTMVPFAIRKPVEVSTSIPPANVPFFKWTPENAETLPGRTDIQIDAAGAVVKVASQNNQTATKSNTFLLDLSEMPYTPERLKLNLQDKGKDFNSSAQIQYSNDLASWRAYDAKQTIAYFSGANTEAKYTLNIPSDGARYLLLTLGENSPPLLGVQTEFASKVMPGKIKTSLLQGVKSEDGLSVEYNTNGYYPIVAIDFILPQADSMPIELKNRISEHAPWAFKSKETIYRFKEDDSGKVRKNKPFEVTSRAPYWQIKAAGDLPFATVPEMQIFWEPYQVVWLARGTGPWILAYGNSDYGPVYDNYLNEASDQKTLPASISGEETYTPRPMQIEEQSPAYQQWILWGVLILAVLILSVLAYSMARSMNKK